jgi:hypothetical protein
MDFCSEENPVYLNRKTGQFAALTGDAIQAAEEDEEPDSEWEQDIAAKASEVLNSEDWLALPSQFEIHEWRIMEDFCYTVEDKTLREDLLDAIRGSGAFGRFKSMAQRHGVIDAWYSFRGAAFERIAVEWLEANEVPYTSDVAGK